MAQIGLNHRLSVARTQKMRAHEGVLGASVAPVSTPIGPLEVFTFANGSRIDAYYVDPADAVSPDQHMKAIWLEFEVEDERAAVAALERRGIRPFEYSTRSTSISRRPAGGASASRNARKHASSDRRGGSHD